MPTTLPRIDSPLAAIDVARCIINVAHNQTVDVPERQENLHEDITHLKLQKMLYFAQAAHLAAHGTQLFSDEIEAWKFGPVVPTVYDVFRNFASQHIPSEEGREGSQPLMEFLADVWQTFGKYSSIELMHLSHKVGPWEQYYQRGQNVVIPTTAIQDAFRVVFNFDGQQPATQGTAA